LLDTPDHFDYDSACTMILNLACLRVILVNSNDVRFSLGDGTTGAAVCSAGGY